MKHSASLALVMVLALGVAGSAAAQGTAGTESFVGVVKAVSGSSVTVERGTITGVFKVDAKTHIAAKGATSKTRENQAAGKPGLTVPDAVHVGDQVLIKYHEMSGAMMATDIQVRVQSVQLASKN